MEDRKNPWAGLASYQDGDARQFCGRDNESYDVATLVDNNIFVTLYGKSGIGKSSLLNAGVFPRLRKMGYLPVAVRLGIEAEGVSLQSCILKKLDAAVASVGSFRSCEIVSMPEDDQEETWLWSHFARSRFEDSAGRVLFPVLVFDQFEEVFRSRPREAGTLLRQIHYMMDESHAIPATKDYSYDFNFRFIVSIREDELYRLEDSLDGNYLPDMKKCRYRLRDLSSKGVRDVILIPGGPFIAKGEEDAVVEAIIGAVQGTSGGAVSTNILSLACSRSYDEMVRRSRPAIDQGLIGEIVSDNLFEKYYLEATADLPAEARRFIEDHLVDSADRRNSVSETDFFKAIPDGEMLIEDGPRKILQRVSVASDTGQTRIELVHDSFCEPIARFRRKRQQRRRNYVAAGAVLAALLVFGISALIIHSMKQREWKMLENRARFLSEKAVQLSQDEDSYMARRILMEVIPANLSNPKKPFVAETEYALRMSWLADDAIIKMPGEIVESIAVSPDGKIVAAGTSEGALVLLSVASGKVLDRIKVSSGAVQDISFSSDGHFLASCSYSDKEISLINLENPYVPYRIKGHTGEVSSVSFIPNSHRLVSGSLDKTVLIWDTDKGEMIQAIDSPEEIDAVAVTNDETRIIAVTGRYNHRAMIWDISTGGILENVDIGFGMGFKIFVTPDDMSVLFCPQNGCLSRFDLLGGELLQLQEWCELAVMMPDGRSYVDRDVVHDELACRDIKTGAILSKVKKHPLHSLPYCMAFSLDGKFLFVGSEGAIEMKDFNLESSPGQYDNVLSQISTRAKWSRLVSRRSPGSPEEFRIVNAETKDTVWRITLANNEYHSYTMSEDQRILAIISRGSGISLWDVDENKQILRLDHEDALSVACCAINQDNSLLASGHEKKIMVWDIVSGEKLFQLEDSLSVHELAFTPDGDYLAVGHFYGVNIWNIKEHNMVLSLKGPSSVVNCFAFSPNGKVLAAGSQDRHVYLWDKNSGEFLKKLEGNTGSIREITFSPDGELLIAIGDHNNDICVWNVQSGILLFRQSVSVPMPRVFFSPEADHIICIGNGEIKVIVFLPFQTVIDRTREQFKDYPLTIEERRKYFLE